MTVCGHHSGLEVLLYSYVMPNEIERRGKVMSDGCSVRRHWHCQTATHTRRQVENRGASLVLNEAFEHVHHGITQVTVATRSRG